jgi:hypothetical protein
MDPVTLIDDSTCLLRVWRRWRRREGVVKEKNQVNEFVRGVEESVKRFFGREREVRWTEDFMIEMTALWKKLDSTTFNSRRGRRRGRGGDANRES